MNEEFDPIKTQSLGHLGLVASRIKQLRIVEKINNRPINTCFDCKAKDKTIASLQDELKEKQSTNESLLLRAFTSDAEELDDLVRSSLKKHGLFQ